MSAGPFKRSAYQFKTQGQTGKYAGIVVQPETADATCGGAKNEPANVPANGFVLPNFTVKVTNGKKTGIYLSRVRVKLPDNVAPPTGYSRGAILTIVALSNQFLTEAKKQNAKVTYLGKQWDVKSVEDEEIN